MKKEQIWRVEEKCTMEILYLVSSCFYKHRLVPWYPFCFKIRTKVSPIWQMKKRTVMTVISFDRSSSPIELHGVVMSSLDPNPNSTF